MWRWTWSCRACCTGGHQTRNSLCRSRISWCFRPTARPSTSNRFTRPWRTDGRSGFWWFLPSSLASVCQKFVALRVQEKTLLSNWMAKGFRDIAERPAVVAATWSSATEALVQPLFLLLRTPFYQKGSIYFTWASWDILSIFKCCCVAVESSFLWQYSQQHLEWIVWRMLPCTISIGLCQFVLWHCCGWLWHKASKLQVGDEDIKALLVPAQDLDRVWTCDPLRYHRFPQISHFNGRIGAYCGIPYSWTSIWWKCCLHVMANKVAQLEAGNQDPWDTACNWLLQSDHLWQDWLLAQRSSSCMQSHTYIHTASAPFLKSMMDMISNYFCGTAFWTFISYSLQ